MSLLRGFTWKCQSKLSLSLSDSAFFLAFSLLCIGEVSLWLKGALKWSNMSIKGRSLSKILLIPWQQKPYSIRESASKVIKTEKHWQDTLSVLTKNTHSPRVVLQKYSSAGLSTRSVRLSSHHSWLRSHIFPSRLSICYVNGIISVLEYVMHICVIMWQYLKEDTDTSY